MHDETETPSMLDAALSYAGRGWRVLPLHNPTDSATGCDCRRASCDKPGKHPRILDWTNRATTDEETMRRWFGATWPRANVGIATGVESGLVVVDVDVHSGGFVSLARLEAMHGPLPSGPRVRTGSGGMHAYFAHPGGHIPNSVGTIAPGIDIRADGGLVVAPPSRHVSGAPYQWD
jgi:putative DNA primase/helicase